MRAEHKVYGIWTIAFAAWWAFLYLAIQSHWWAIGSLVAAGLGLWLGHVVIARDERRTPAPLEESAFEYVELGVRGRVTPKLLWMDKNDEEPASW